MKPLIYLHGGPGMNSNPEMHLLKRPYLDAGFRLLFWNEPSINRPLGYPFRETDSFQNLLDSAESFFLEQYREFQGEKLPIFAFCYGCIPAFHLMKLHPEKISKVILVTPDFCFAEANENMFRLAMKSYEKQRNNFAVEELSAALQNYDGSFSATTERGFRQYVASPELFNYYWSDEKSMEQFCKYFSGDDYSLDIEAFFKVRKSMYPVKLNSCDIPCLLIHGTKDRIISIESEIKNLEGQIENLQIVTIECDHYVHIEALETCIATISNFLKP